MSDFCNGVEFKTLGTDLYYCSNNYVIVKKEAMCTKCPSCGRRVIPKACLGQISCKLKSKVVIEIDPTIKPRYLAGLEIDPLLVGITVHE